MPEIERGSILIHQYKSNGYHIVLDVNSGAVHVVDELCYDVIACLSGQNDAHTEETLKESAVFELLKEQLGGRYIEDELKEALEEVTELNALKGSFANIEYALPNGQVVKFWDDNKIYLGNQLHKEGSDRCYGIIADEKYLMVSEYSGYGADSEIIVFKRWN